VTDALEAGRQHMQQGPSDELDALDAEDALVADLHPVRVAPEIVEHAVRPGGRVLGMDDPVAGVERGQRRAKTLLRRDPHPSGAGLTPRVR
jgi:hypothetical protein